jgi:hypothetical protein
MQLVQCRSTTCIQLVYPHYTYSTQKFQRTGDCCASHTPIGYLNGPKNRSDFCQVDGVTYVMRPANLRVMTLLAPWVEAIGITRRGVPQIAGPVPGTFANHLPCRDQRRCRALIQHGCSCPGAWLQPGVFDSCLDHSGR